MRSAKKQKDSDLVAPKTLSPSTKLVVIDEEDEKGVKEELGGGWEGGGGEFDRKKADLRQLAEDVKSENAELRKKNR